MPLANSSCLPCVQHPTVHLAVPSGPAWPSKTLPLVQALTRSSLLSVSDTFTEKHVFLAAEGVTRKVPRCITPTLRISQLTFVTLWWLVCIGANASSAFDSTKKNMPSVRFPMAIRDAQEKIFISAEHDKSSGGRFSPGQTTYGHSPQGGYFQAADTSRRFRC